MPDESTIPMSVSALTPSLSEALSQQLRELFTRELALAQLLEPNIEDDRDRPSFIFTPDKINSLLRNIKTLKKCSDYYKIFMGLGLEENWSSVDKLTREEAFILGGDATVRDYTARDLSPRDKFKGFLLHALAGDTNELCLTAYSGDTLENFNKLKALLLCAILAGNSGFSHRLLQALINHPHYNAVIKQPKESTRYSKLSFRIFFRINRAVFIFSLGALICSILPYFLALPPAAVSALAIAGIVALCVGVVAGVAITEAARKAIHSLFLNREESRISHLINCYPKFLKAAADSGNEELFNYFLQRSFCPVKYEKTLCEKPVLFLPAPTLMHYAARGGNINIFNKTIELSRWWGLGCMPVSSKRSNASCSLWGGYIVDWAAESGREEIFSRSQTVLRLRASGNSVPEEVAAGRRPLTLFEYRQSKTIPITEAPDERAGELPANLQANSGAC